jgi:hypothetical protein
MWSKVGGVPVEVTNGRQRQIQTDARVLPSDCLRLRFLASLFGGSKLSEVAAEDELANGGHDANRMLLELLFDISTLERGFC